MTNSTNSSRVIVEFNSYSGGQTPPEAVKKSSPIAVELQELDTEFASMASCADSALVKLIDLHKMIAEMRAAFEQIDPECLDTVSHALAKAEAMLGERCSNLAGAIVHLRAEYKLMLPVFE